MEEKAKKQTYGIEVETPYRHKLPVQLRFNDIDALGHVNNSVYFTLFDLAKTKYFNEVRNEEIDWQTVDIVIANVNCNFFSPTYYHENLEAQTQTLRIGTKSIHLVQRLVNVDTGETKAQCTVVMVGFDSETCKSKPISDCWRSALENYEGRTL